MSVIVNPLFMSSPTIPYTGPLPGDYDNLELWLRLDQQITLSNGKVISLGDLSGNNRNHAVTEENASLYISDSVNGKPGVEHCGRYLTATMSGLSSVNAFTRFTALSRIVLPEPEDVPIAISTLAASSAANPDPFVGWNIDTIGVNTPVTQINWNSGENKFCGSNWEEDVPVLLIGSYNGSGTGNVNRMRIYFNGERMMPSYFIPASGPLPLSYSLLGDKNVSWGQYETPQNMHLLEDALYSKFFSDEEIQEFVEYFFWRYAFSRPQHRIAYQLMTGASTPSPQAASATSTYSTYYPWCAFSGDSDNFYWSNSTPSVASPQKLVLDFGENVTLVSYDVRNPDRYAGYNPCDWSLKTSLDNSNWTTQHAVSNNAIQQERVQISGNIHGWDFESPIVARYVSLEITKQNSSGGVIVGDLMLWKQEE